MVLQMPGESREDRERNMREWMDEAEQMQIDEGDITPSETGYGQSPTLADNFYDNNADGSPISGELLDAASLEEAGMHIEDLNADDVLQDEDSYNIDELDIEGVALDELNLKDEDAEALDAEDPAQE